VDWRETVGLGSFVEDTGGFIFDMAGAAGRAVILLGQALRQFRHLFRNFDKFLNQVFICGVAALPVVTITGLFTGMVIAAQTGNELKKFGLAGFLMGPIVGGSIVRELGPVLTAICVAGFVGGGMASLIATMRVNEEIDALDVMAVNPVRYLVMPRLAAMMVVLPLLTVYTNVIGILGGAVVSFHQVGVTYNEYYDMLKWVLDVGDLSFSLIKAFVFGAIITIVSCEQGYHATGGAEGVGRATMRSVVYSFLLILIANFLLFSLVYRTFIVRILKS
jgi:phospholipid/cholesterol/gamma-HCH transport system permease protein